MRICRLLSYDEWMSLKQEDVQRRFESLGTDAWTTVYESWSESGQAHGGIYCALAPVSLRSKALGGQSWNVHKGDFRPGFSQSNENGEWVTRYEPGAIDRGFEPLILLRTFYGVIPGSLEVVEQFRLYHNLYWDELTSQYMKPHDDGTSSVAIKVIGEKRIDIRTKYLRQYQAARQMDLVVFVDSVRYSDAPGASLPEREEWTTDTICAGLYPSTKDPGEPVFSRYLATRVVPPPPVEKAGIWPYEEADNYFPEFIIGTGEDGDEVRYTCNPDALANYFGANPGAPQFLTPVHFRREVLQKYYEKPELYTVEDGYLRCAALWGLHVDNSSEDAVVVFLGDLGESLPRQERDYWRSFNVPPDGPMSETFFRRSFLAQFAEPTASDLQVRSKYVSMGKSWHERYGWDLFRKPAEADAGQLHRLRLPLNHSQAEFEASIRTMTLLFVDAINEAQIQELLPDRRDDERGIAKLKRWLQQEGYPHVDRDIQFLRNLQEVRSKATAHRKGSGYEKALDKVFGKLRGPAAAKTLFESALVMLAGLDEWLALTAKPDGNNND